MRITNFKNNNMENTRIQFTLIRISKDEFVADLREMYIKGFVQFYMLNDFLNDNDQVKEIDKSLNTQESKEITLEIWINGDNFRSWYDYKVIDNEDF